jgi:hypothetical protein
LVQAIQTSRFPQPSPDPSGIVYLPEIDRLLIADSEVDETPLYRGINLFTATRRGSGAGAGTTVAFSREPSGLGYNPRERTLFVSDDDAARIFVVRPGGDAVHGTADDLTSKFPTSSFGSADPEGVTYDTASGHLFICDGSGREVYEVLPVNGTFGDAGDVVKHFDLARHGLRDCEGIAVDPVRNTLLAVDPSTKRIFELTKDGALVRVITLAATPARKPAIADIAIAPTSNRTDPPAQTNYWVVDRHVDNGQDPEENDGLLYEIAVDRTPPTLSILAIRITGPRVHALFRICDDSFKNLTVLQTDSRPRRAPSTRRFVTRSAPNPCAAYTRSWIPAADFRRPGSYTITLRARDAAGRTSQPARRTLDIGG